MTAGTTTGTSVAASPNAMMVRVRGVSAEDCQALSELAVEIAQRLAPKSSGQGAAGISSYAGRGFYGLTWADDYMWFQEHGIRAFTMRSLAGKTIPMWVDDLDGSEARKIPVGERPSRTRTTASGKRQVLIFRRVAQMRARRTVVGPNGVARSTPMSYPGAPGRIGARQVVDGHSTGKIARMVNGRSHSGVRWRHPGLVGRGFMQHAITEVARGYGLSISPVQTLRVAQGG